MCGTYMKHAHKPVRAGLGFVKQWCGGKLLIFEAESLGFESGDDFFSGFGLMSEGLLS